MMEATSAECKKVHLGKHQKPKENTKAFPLSKKKESSKDLAPLRRSVAKPEKNTSIVHEDKRSSTVQSKVERKSSLMSKSKSQYEIDDEEEDNDEDKVNFNKLVKEPPDLMVSDID